jgi:hypothetical protein
VRDLGLLARVVYRLNNPTGDRYVELFDRYRPCAPCWTTSWQAGRTRPPPPVLSFTDLGWEIEQAVGAGVASLAELKHRFGLPMQDGFALTAAGVRQLLAHKTCPPELKESLQREAAALRRRCGRACPLAVAVHRLGAADLPGEPLALARHLDDLPLVIRPPSRAIFLRATGARADGAVRHVREAPEPALRGWWTDHTWSSETSVSVSQPEQPRPDAGEVGAGVQRPQRRGAPPGAPQLPFGPCARDFPKPGNFDHPTAAPLSLLKNGLLRHGALVHQDPGRPGRGRRGVMPLELGWI